MKAGRLGLRLVEPANPDNLGDTWYDSKFTSQSGTDFFTARRIWCREMSSSSASAADQSRGALPRGAALELFETSQSGPKGLKDEAHVIVVTGDTRRYV